MERSTLFYCVLLAPMLAATGLRAQAPSVTTPLFSNTTATGSTASASVTQGALNNIIVERGITYAAGKNLANPPANATKVTAKVGTGAYTCKMTGLTKNTVYTVWSYVIHRTVSTSNSLKLSAAKSLTTATDPTVTTNGVSAIAGTTATCGGNVTGDGRLPVTARGVVWSTAQNPTVSLATRTTNGTGTGPFTSNITGLQGSTTYNVRAYATNGAGTSYGAQQTFTTAAVPADLQARPLGSSGVNRPLFRPTSGSFGAAGITYLRVPDPFCAGLSGGTLEAHYPCQLPDSCDGFKHTITLPPVIYSATNTGAGAASAFVVTLSRQTTVNGTAGTLVQVASQNVTGLNPNASSANFSFTPPGTVDVYTFPDDNPGLCFVRCDPNRGGTIVPIEETAYLVRVDGGNAAGAASQVAESNENNNQQNPMP